MSVPFVVYDSTTYQVAFTGNCQDIDLLAQAGVGQSVVQMDAFLPPELVVIIPGPPDIAIPASIATSIGFAEALAISAGSGLLPSSTEPVLWSPSPVADTGTITSLTVNRATYFRVGTLVFWNFSMTITTNGSGADQITVDLPTVPVRFFSCPGHGVFRGPGGSGTLYVFTSEGNQFFHLLKYDGTYPGADGTGYYVSGFYADSGY